MFYSDGTPCISLQMWKYLGTSNAHILCLLEKIHKNENFYFKNTWNYSLQINKNKFSKTEWNVRNSSGCAITFLVKFQEYNIFRFNRHFHGSIFYFNPVHLSYSIKFWINSNQFKYLVFMVKKNYNKFEDKLISFAFNVQKPELIGTIKIVSSHFKRHQSCFPSIIFTFPTFPVWRCSANNSSFQIRDRR